MKTTQVPKNVTCLFLPCCDNCQHLTVTADHNAYYFDDKMLQEVVVSCERYDSCKRLFYKEDSK